jgi:SPOR domain
VPTAAAAGNAATRAAPAGATVLEAKPGGRPAGSLDASAELSTSIPLGKYFQVGKFSDELQADRLIERLDQSGYRAVVVPKNLLWMSSFEVLAGPYGSEKDAQVARRGLRSEGFKAQSLPRQSREFWLPVVRKLYSDVDIPEGFVVSWESYGADATVRFVRGAETIATVRGEWVKEKQRHDQDGVMYDGKGEGSRTLLEIWFRGMDQSVVFHPAPGSQAMTF